LEFTQRFNKLYNKIPAEVKPSQPSAKVTYAGAFDPDFALLLRERRSLDLPKMQDDAVEIESNMMASGKLKAKTENVNKENRKFKEQGGPSGSGKSTGDKIEEMARVIQQLSNKISKMELEKPRRDNFPRKDFRKNPEPQGPHKTIKNEDQKVQAPFKTEDYIGEEDFGGFEQLDEDIECLGDDNRYPYVSRQDYEASLMRESKSEDTINDNATDDYAYQSVADDIIADLQGRYNLRSRNKNLPNIQAKKVLLRNDNNEENPKVADKQSANRNITDNPVQLDPVNTPTPVNIQKPVKENKVASQRKTEKKIMEAPQIENDKAVGNFNLENEISKIKIPIPLVELAKNPVYRKQIAKMINFSEKESQADSINLEDDRPIISFGPHVEGPKDTVAPFYITLTVFDHLLHNCMLDSGASHNVMPKAIMDKLGLEVTRPYGDLYSFDSRRVKCIGMIKDLVVNLAQIPSKSILMDVVVADIPPKYGMLLSRSWGAKLGGSIQLDMTYATIPVFGGQFTRLYRETRMAFTVSDPKNPKNHPVYIADQDLGNCILSLDDDFEIDVDNIDTEEKIPKNEIKENVYSTGTWKMFFDGASSYLGAGAGVILIAPDDQFVIPFSYRLQWYIDCTNNVCEYEALVLGLEAARKMKIKNIEVFGDAELIIRQVNRQYQAKHPRLRTYRNCVWDLVENFFTSVNFHFVPRSENQQADALAKAASTFDPPTSFNLKYHIQMRHRPSIPDNVQHWQVFEDDEQLRKFLESVDEFSETYNDQENQNDPFWIMQEGEDVKEFHDKIVDHRMLVLKNNQIPKGLIPLERLFNKDDIPSKSTLQPQPEEVEDCNIGTVNNPKNVKLSKFLSVENKNKYTELLKKYKDVFAWSYEDLKTYDTSVIEHKIPLKPGVKPFKQKLRQFNPILLPVIEKEVKKLLDAKIIVPLRYSDWVANLVPVRKKNGEIRLCVDFRNLNKSSLKDNYPLPKMDHVLEKVVGATRMSMIDGFSGYNQIVVCEPDREKTAFTTPWGTFMYDKMPFGLMNAGATFQRAMDIAFIGERDKFVVIYLDDLTVFSKSDEDHIIHLKQTFEKCRKYGLSLNPKKSHFAMQEGKLLGHIVSRDGIRIDPKRVEAIETLAIPRNVKEIQSFLGKIIFLRRFVPNFAEIVKLITDMLKRTAKSSGRLKQGHLLIILKKL
jgi:ribonuclease HI